MNWPAHPRDMGGDPGSAGGSEVPVATLAAVHGPRAERGMPCICTGAEGTGARAVDGAGILMKNTKT